MNRSVKELLSELNKKSCRHGVHAMGKPDPYRRLVGHEPKRLARSPALPHNKNFGH